ncbi:hypothetical protein AALO_G00118200 [Alosa alosa]|uniref:Uncharacterized protein n=1 Tax=Alosa alosa TaxID=278164 RepID=A0AAV6GUB5_9TELE|nr:uncharacterized protein LOC125298851 [Alosa alosa]KAG5277487.1 hypothetical protein AALO_G00118200 [Alosa alosa]
MASTRIQLFDVNQQILSMWHNQRSKAMMWDTITIAVPGPSAPQTAAERLPAPRTLLQQPQQPDHPLQHRLPADTSGLAPELYDVIAALQSATSSSSAMDTISSTSGTPAPSTSTAAATVPPIAGAIPRSTAWRHKIQAEQERRAREEWLLLKPFKKVSRFQCRRCGQPKTREYGHSRYKRETFCARADGATVEQWLQELKRREHEGPLPPP